MRRRRGQTQVDLLHLLEDLRDAYPGALEETILTELVANSLDAGATRIEFLTDPAAGAFVGRDDGRGMLWKDLRNFHNLAASSKSRGEGIGFAGVGIKLALLVSHEVLTESRRGKSHVATHWRLAGHNQAPYEQMTPPGRVEVRGTAVRLALQNPLSPLVDAGYIEHTVRRHFAALLDPTFDAALRAIYPEGIRFFVNGAELTPIQSPDAERASLEIRVGRQRKPSGVGRIERHALPLPDDLRGIAVSTFGKVIRHGWDWLGIQPATPELITGIIEVPSLSGCLTLNKGDFVRTGPRGATFLSYRRAIQEAVQRQLDAWGQARDEAALARRKLARPLERDLQQVLVDMADDFPLLSSLVEHRLGGQRKLPIATGQGEGSGFSPGSVATGETAREVEIAGVDDAQPADAAVAAEPSLSPPQPESSGQDSPESADGPPAPGASTTKKPARYGLRIELDAREGDAELGRLVESTVWVNTAHPAYQRAASSRSEGYHMALAVALALAPLAAGRENEHAFILAFLERWGQATGRAVKRRGAR